MDTLVATNNDWSGNSQLVQAAALVGAQPLSDLTSKDATLLLTLDPGVYSGVVSSANNGSGIALVEVYIVP